MIAAGYPANFFVVNPTVAGGGANDVLPWGSSYYDSGQVELRRRLATGMQFQVNYSYSKSLANGATASSARSLQPIRCATLAMNKMPDGVRYPPGHQGQLHLRVAFWTGPPLPLRRQQQGGQEGAGRLGNGRRPPHPVRHPLSLSGFYTVNGNGSGVVLHNITLKQLQSMVGIIKTQNPVSGVPQVYYLPTPVARRPALTSSNNTNLITNTYAAFGINSLTPAQVDPSAPYLGPAAPGQWGGLATSTCAGSGTSTSA